MSDTIQRAVELADGWDVTHIFAGEDIAAYNPHGKEYPEASFVLQSPSESGLDALAAALVRQVDALDVELVSGKGSCLIERDDPEFEPFGIQNLGWEEGPDRTMNTLCAIVDSKVLEPERTETYERGPADGAGGMDDFE